MKFLVSDNQWKISCPECGCVEYIKEEYTNAYRQTKVIAILCKDSRHKIDEICISYYGIDKHNIKVGVK